MVDQSSIGERTERNTSMSITLGRRLLRAEVSHVLKVLHLKFMCTQLVLKFLDLDQAFSQLAFALHLFSFK